MTINDAPGAQAPGEVAVDRTSVKVLADSVSPDGVRLITAKLTYPRFIHSEMLRHRVFAHSVGSSRAIPTERLIEQVRTDPFVPTTFNARVRGMGVGDALDSVRAQEARDHWLIAANAAADQAEALMNIGLDKSRANRLLEPFLLIEDIVTGTEWDNFFALRDHAAAQPEFRALAGLMKIAFLNSVPQPLRYGQWHLPLVTEQELVELCDARRFHQPARPGDVGEDVKVVLDRLKRVSASRCARVSYGRDDEETFERTLERAELLMRSGHYSPFEHVARPVDDGGEAGTPDYGRWAAEWTDLVGNLRGWVSFRKEIPHEDRFDLAEAARDAAVGA